MVPILKKLLTFLLLLRYPKIPGKYRWFIRFRYLGSIRQLKYLIHDSLIRRPYKQISFRGEFQQELLHVIPFAYWHYLNGTLKSTTSTSSTKELYFFSPSHSEVDKHRDYRDNFNVEIPNAPHDLKLIRSKWVQVPYKAYFKNTIFTYDKPLIVIANRFNTEWNQEPISYLDLSVLHQLFLILKKRYQILYNRPTADRIVNDNSEVQDLGDYSWIKENHPDVEVVNDIYDKHVNKVNNYNHLQLMIYANCSRFISVHGGTATLASCFGGDNIIFSKKGHEHYLKEFENIFPHLSNANIHHVKDYEELMKKVTGVFLK